MKAIWKYGLKVDDRQVVKIPVGSEILTVQTQNGHPCLWVLVNPKEVGLGEITLRIYGIGHNIEHDNLTYIDTFQINGGELVFHAFQEY